MKLIICSPDGDTIFSNIVAGVLERDTLAPYFCLDYILQMSTDIIKAIGMNWKGHFPRGMHWESHFIIGMHWKGYFTIGMHWEGHFTIGMH